MNESPRDDYTDLKTCLACGSPSIRGYLDLGSHPLANSFSLPDDPPLRAYPLRLNVCRDCWHSQLGISVNPEIIFRDYLYVSGTTQASLDYFARFADRLTGEYGEGLRVLEIASNDGSLLAALNERGHSTLGVDPAANLVRLAADKEVNTISAFWPSNLLDHLKPGYDLIIAMNVLAHVPDPLGFLLAARDVMTEASTMVVQTSQARMVENREFDTAYHEHLSFFNCSSMEHLAQRAGMRVRAVDLTPVHGTSYVWTLELDRANAESSPSLLELEAHERAAGVFDEASYDAFGEHANALVEQVRASVQDHRERGFTIVGYGAAAKGNTFLNYSAIHPDVMIDANPLKQGRLAPGSRSAVLAPATLAKVDTPCLFIITAWNFYDEIVEHIRSHRNREGDFALTYYPTFTLREL